MFEEQPKYWVNEMCNWIFNMFLNSFSHLKVHDIWECGPLNKIVRDNDQWITQQDYRNYHTLWSIKTNQNDNTGHILENSVHLG